MWVADVPETIRDFPYARQVVHVERTTSQIKQGRQVGFRADDAFAITDLTPEQAGPAQLLAFNRGHWSIENKIHYVRDRTYDEDRSQVRKNRAPEVMATLRNIAIGLFGLAKVPRTSIKQCMEHCNRKPGVALRLIGLAACR